MCGIVGAFNFDNSNVDIRQFAQMTESLKHRGPDSTGTIYFSLSNGHVQEVPGTYPYESQPKAQGALGATRLSVLDLSENGRQPMINRKAKTILVFNGEIYNAPEYREHLKHKGFRFKSQTDTEVVLFLYQCYGFLGMIERLNGMFAICIADLNSKRIYLARDRLGIKPLYYYAKPNVFLFSSEVKSFLFHEAFARDINHENLDEYTKFGYISGKDTLLKNVCSIEPGEYIEIRGNSVSAHTYWDLYDGQPAENMTFAEACTTVRDNLIKSVKLRLASDVKIGCQLSGGIDSSLITAFTKKHLPDYDLHAISIIFNNRAYTEEKWIDYVSDKLSIQTHKYTLTEEYFFDNFVSAIWHNDFPLSRPSSIAIKLLSEKARDFFTVFLSGEGSDELYGGYERFYCGSILVIPTISRLLRRSSLLRRIVTKRYLSADSNDFDPVAWYISRNSYMGLPMLKRLKKDFESGPFMMKRKKLFESGNGDFVRKAQRYELKTWLVDLLLRQDKMTMANSIENRVPFIDHNTVDSARRIPTRYLVKLTPVLMMGTKVVLKDIAKKKFNKKFAYRYKKGFPIPVNDFLAYRKFQEWMYDSIIPNIKQRGIYDGRWVEQCFDRLSEIGNEGTEALWRAVNFEAWAQLFIDGKGWPS